MAAARHMPGLVTPGHSGRRFTSLQAMMNVTFNLNSDSNLTQIDLNLTQTSTSATEHLEPWVMLYSTHWCYIALTPAINIAI